MAGIDKIYGTKAQYVEFKKWLDDNQVPIKLSKDETDMYIGNPTTMLPSQMLYEYDWDNMDVDENLDEFAISNFPVSIDKWLWDKCPIGFVRERLKEQYSFDKLN